MPVLADRMARFWHLSRLVRVISLYSEFRRHRRRDGLRWRHRPLWATACQPVGAGPHGDEHRHFVNGLVMALSAVGRVVGFVRSIDPGELGDLDQGLSTSSRPAGLLCQTNRSPGGKLDRRLLLPFLLGTVIYSATLGTTIRLGTYGTAFVTALIVLCVAVALQPIREHFDAERRPGTKIAFGDLKQTVSGVIRDPALRDIAFAAFAFGGMQSLFAGFFVLFMIDGLSYTEFQAGAVYAVSSFQRFSRIVWGLLGASIMSPRTVLAAIGLIGGAAGFALTFADVGPGV